MSGGRREAGCKQPGVRTALPGASRTGSALAAFRREEGKHGAERSLARSGGGCSSGGGGDGGGGGPGGERRTGERRPLRLRQGRAAEGEAGLREGGGRKARVLGGPSRLLRRCRVCAVPGLARGGAGRPRSRGHRVRASLVGGPVRGRGPIFRGSLGLVPGALLARSHAGTAVRCGALAEAIGRGRGGMGTAHAPDSPSILLPSPARGSSPKVPVGLPRVCLQALLQLHAASRVSREKVFHRFCSVPESSLVLSVEKLSFGPACEQTRSERVMRGAPDVCGGLRPEG